MYVCDYENVEKNKRIAHDGSRSESYGLSRPHVGLTSHKAAILYQTFRSVINPG